MGTETDQLRQELDQRRDDAAERISEIEHRVESVTEQARTGVEETTDKIKESLDLRKQIDENPLLAVGAGLLAGLFLGGAIGGDDNQRSGYSGGSRNSGLMHTLRQTAQQAGLEDTFSAASAALMASTKDRVKGNVSAGGDKADATSQQQ